MRYKVLCLVTGLCLLLTGCGGSSSSYGETAPAVRNDVMSVDSAAGFSSNTPAMKSEEGFVESGLENSTTETGVIDTDKLVYRGHLTIRTLDYEKSVNDFKQSIVDVGGFIENESFNKDGGYYRYWEDSDEDATRSYSATMRVPASEYQTVFELAEKSGGVVSASSNVENITQQYNTTATSLQIYEAKYKSYLKLLAEASTVEEMVAIESELTEIEVRLAEYKTSLSVMDTDVAYSYISVNIQEVLKRSEVHDKDTFLSRLGEAFEGSWKGILSFLEGVVIFLIYSFWYIILLIVIVVLFYKYCKKKTSKSVSEGVYVGKKKAKAKSITEDTVDKKD